MGVVYPYEGINRSQVETNKVLGDISAKLSKLIPSPNMMKRVKGNGLEAFSRARLVWWTKVNEAARYHIRLFVVTEEQNYEVGIFDVEREKLYISFPDIPDDVPCLAVIEAEDRSGKTIANGEIKL